MIKKILTLSIFSLLIITKLSFSHPFSYLFYGAPFYPEYQTALNDEPMPATATSPVAAPESEMAVSALPADDSQMNTSAVTYNSNTVPVTTTRTITGIRRDPVIRDFRDIDKVYVPEPKNTAASEIKKNHPIRDFRADYWKNKYYRDDFKNTELYKDTYKNYNYYK